MLFKVCKGRDLGLQSREFFEKSAHKTLRTAEEPRTAVTTKVGCDAREPGCGATFLFGFISSLSRKSIVATLTVALSVFRLSRSPTSSLFLWRSVRTLVKPCSASSIWASVGGFLHSQCHIKIYVPKKRARTWY